ncbi:type I restriction-modification system subunit M [Acinetobacter nectaris]|uniref:type I restriction-modification system subunit M n=1 Tax=Acinetobacter nectaris TaxID=1219382 RepID=UPI001F1B7E8B|nr:class I SAM-dependent DNA methyltransferase [Acinetobacter nectaris]MCF8999834.1 SAM-dependent DNA methyltransferase [Acinetobacter nectaris]MCF9026747.1 SAM-dependent DNA methyltransferase [Acinetobacter nectaris]
MTTELNQHPQHSKLVGLVWNIANVIRGPYRPPQYRRVMLPLIVLGRFDAILAPYADEMKTCYYNAVKDQENKKPNVFLEKQLSQISDKNRRQNLYNISGFNLQKLLGDPDHFTANLTNYIDGFSPKAKDIFAKFEFAKEIEKLDDANRLYKVFKEFDNSLTESGLSLSLDSVNNLQMGYLFEELVRKFNEQANEEAGDHFTPREVIELMVNLIFEEDQNELIKAGVHRSIYDPTAGTGGMLSESEKFLKNYNEKISLDVYGQEYNPESYAICCADLLIKDEPAENIVYGDTLGVKGKEKEGYVSHDGHLDKDFHYMFSNPPFGVEWKNQKDFIDEESKKGFSGRFGAGLPRINDGSLLFAQHMISKMKLSPSEGGEGSRIAVVFNGSPLFTGDAGSGESNIRRWIIENDWLEAIIALPDQMFYNTGIYTYIWIISNKKSEQRKGKVQLIDGTLHYQKMAKSLGNKRHELSKAHIAELTKFYANFKDQDVSHTFKTTAGENKICSKIFDNKDFGYLKLTVERPLRLNFTITAERIAELDKQSAFENLTKSKKVKNLTEIKQEEQAGQLQQEAIKKVLTAKISEKLWKNRDEFLKVLNPILKGLTFTLSAPVKKAILEVLSERDPTADVCKDSKGNIEPDTYLRDTELVSLPENLSLPLPISYDKEADLSELLPQVRKHCDAYFKAEVLPHVSDAWIDYSKTKVGYEIPINRHFYVYTPPRPLDEIKAEIVELEREIMQMLGGLSA